MLLAALCSSTASISLAMEAEGNRGGSAMPVVCDYLRMARSMFPFRSLLPQLISQIPINYDWLEKEISKVGNAVWKANKVGGK